MRLSLSLAIGCAVSVLAGAVDAQTVSGYVTTSAPTYTANTSAPLSLDPNGNLRTTSSGGGGGGTVTQGPPNAGGAGNAWFTQGVGVAGTPAGGVMSVQGVSGGTNQNVNVNAALPAGSAIIGKVGIDQTTPGVTNAVTIVPSASGGLTMATITAAASTNATNLKASAGTLSHISGYTAAALPAWVTFYNTAGTPTCGSGIVYEMLIPVNATSGGGFVEDIPNGLGFSTGIGYCITTGIGGTGAVAATSIVVNFGYK